MNNLVTNNTPKQNLILDTNILFYFGDRNINTDLLKYLLSLQQVGFGLAISKVTIVELLSGIPKAKEAEVIKILRIFTQYDIDDNVVVTASQISTVYKNDKHVTSDQIDIADRIIASTSILTGSLIVTSDINHFPRPYFIEKQEKIFFYKNGNKTNLRVLQALQPNIRLINHAFNCRS